MTSLLFTGRIAGGIASRAMLWRRAPNVPGQRAPAIVSVSRGLGMARGHGALCS